jgi:hypothetical protein
MRTDGAGETGPRTQALKRALQQTRDETVAADLLFLEEWQMQRHLDVAASLRASQIRRANPALAAAIHAELTGR